MANRVMLALSGEEIVEQNSLATVTSNCIVIENSNRGVHTVIAVARLSNIRIITTATPSFLVISTGLLVIAAAALFSKEGGWAGIPIAVLGIGFLIAYAGSRRAAVAFVVDSETTTTSIGTLTEASALVSAVRSVQKKMRA